MGKDHELLEAARVGDLAHVEKLLYPRSKSTVLAATLGLRFGANVNCQDHSGYTPLHHASLNGHSDIVKILLKVGANCNIADSKGSCPLHLASWNGHSEIVHMLLSNGSSFASVNELNGDSESALHCASQHGHKEVVQILLENHADPTFRNHREESALDLASQYGRLDVVRLLLTYQPQLLQSSSERFTPLHLASRNGHREVVELLLVHGADINKVGANGTALHEAALFGKAEVVSLLLRRGAKPNVRNAKGRTPLELVSQLDTSFSRTIARFIEGHVSLREGLPDANQLTPPVHRVTSKSFDEPKFDVTTRYSDAITSTSYADKKYDKLKEKSLRRSSSARSSRSLPRLPPSSHHSKSFRFHRPHFFHAQLKDKESKITQHHPSIDMFPVETPGTPKRENRRSASLPASPSTQKSLMHLTSPHDDEVFFSFATSSPKHNQRQSVVTIGYGENFRHTTPSFSTFTPKTPSYVPKTPSTLVTPVITPSGHRTIDREVLGVINNTHDGVYENVKFGAKDDPPPLPRKSVALSSPPLSPTRNSMTLPVHHHLLPMKGAIPPAKPPLSPIARSMDKVSPPLPVKQKDKRTASPSATVRNKDTTDSTSTVTKPLETKNTDIATNESQSVTDIPQTTVTTTTKVNDQQHEFSDKSSPKMTKSPLGPTKPTRLAKAPPPPLPPKPTPEAGKLRPPSPNAPPPVESDISSGQSSTRSSLSNHSCNGIDTNKGAIPVPKPRKRVPHRSPNASKTLLSPTESLSPPFSPPSPNTAMQQVSNVLQRVLTVGEDDHSNETNPIIHSTISTSQTNNDELSSNNQIEQSVSNVYENIMEQNLDKINDDEIQSKENEQNSSNQLPAVNETIHNKTVNQQSRTTGLSQTLPSKPKITQKSPKKLSTSSLNENVIYEPTRLMTSGSRSKLQLYDIPFIDDGNFSKNTLRSFCGNFDLSESIKFNAESCKRRKRSKSSNNDSTISNGDVFTNLSANNNNNIAETKVIVDDKLAVNTIAQYTPSEVKRARICSTKSVSEQSGQNALQLTDSRKSKSENDLNKNNEIKHRNTTSMQRKSTSTANKTTLSNVATTTGASTTFVTSLQSTVMSSKTKGIPPEVPPKHLKPKLIRTTDDDQNQNDSQISSNLDTSKISSQDGSLKQRDLKALLLEAKTPISSSTTSLDTSEDWEDNLSDRTEDVEMPRQVRKYRGLIRGSSLNYRSRFSRSCVTSRGVDYDTDEDTYGENNETFAYERISTEAGQRTIVSLDSCERTKIRLNSTSKGSNNESFHVEPSSPIATVVSTNQTSPSHSRSSSYDNNNNSDSQLKISITSQSKMSAPALSSPMSDGLPDFSTIVETVNAVRNRSSPHHESTSGFSSTCSSQTSTMSQNVAPSSKQSSATNDVKDEWAEIASTLTSINSLNKDSVYNQEFEETFWKIMTGSDLPRYVSTWLDKLGLPQYNKVLCGNGFDNINFLASNILQEQDLLDMNIMDASHRRRMLDSAKDLPKIRDLSQLGVTSVPEWLTLIDLKQFSDIFVEVGFDTIEKLKKIKDMEIAALVPLRGHRKRIRASITPQGEKQAVEHKPLVKTKSTSPPLPRSPLLDKVNFFKDYSKTAPNKSHFQSTANTETTSGISSGIGYSTGTTGSSASGCSENRDKLKSDTPSPSKKSRSKERRSSRRSIHRNSVTDTTTTNLKTYKVNDEPFNIPTSEPDTLTLAISQIERTTEQDKENIIMATTNSTATTPSSSLQIPDTTRAKYLSETGDKLPVRAPNETTMEVSVTSWGHNPDDLINDSCEYQAKYLGSMLVQEVKGVTSTVEACAKMKRSTDSMKKIPTITLSISYRGVKFIDSKSKHEIAEHEIQNISFASQDADDLTTFAYITRDARTGNHYCHVFRVTTLDMAFEVILTLGQAFEVAYQLILKDKSTQHQS